MNTFFCSVIKFLFFFFFFVFLYRLETLVNLVHFVRVILNKFLFLVHYVANTFNYFFHTHTHTHTHSHTESSFRQLYTKQTFRLATSHALLLLNVILTQGSKCKYYSCAFVAVESSQKFKPWTPFIFFLFFFSSSHETVVSLRKIIFL